MPNAYLIGVTEAGDVNRVPIGDGVLVGRTHDCGFIVSDSAASRHHMRIQSRGGHFLFEDLKSTNGIYVNDAKQLRGELSHGDVIRIGSTLLRFEVRDHGARSSGSEIRTAFLDSDGRVRASGARDESESLLEAVHQVMNDIATMYEPCTLVDRVLETTMRAIDAQRGAVFFSQAGSLDLLPCPVCQRVHIIEEGELKHLEQNVIEVSRTVVSRVLMAGESILIQDMDNETEINATESMRSLKLNSIMCVPIRGKYGVRGVLYIDTNRPDQRYTRSHLLLSTAVGNSAGMSLENAQMHHQILQKQRIDQELEYAASIQQSFLQDDWPDEDSRYSVFAETHPAKVIGGDFYDVIRPSPDKVGLLIGDVSGKGVPAALTMAQVLTEFRMAAMMETSPAEVLDRLNKTMVKRTSRGMFCTVSYLIVDLNTGDLVGASAGHHPLLRLTSGGETSFALEASGPPIGVLPDSKWQDETLHLEAGESVLLYTDGVTEARAGDTRGPSSNPLREYGEERIAEIVQGLREESPKTIIQSLHQDVLRYTDPQSPHDDCTSAMLRYKG